jgi:hypothetical protein
LNPAFELSIVIGVQHAQENLPDIMRVLRPAAHPRIEVLICYTPDDPDVPTLAGSGGMVRIICGAKGSLIPHLWRDGILAARGERVATTTAHCIPAADWIETLLSADLRQFAALGGVFENDPNASRKACSIFLLRYATLAQPQARREYYNIAADNAVYRRTDLLRHHDLLRRGFWEPSFHHRFLASGLKIGLEPDLRVVHRNQYSTRQFIRQRLAHGREFGLARASSRRLLQRLLLVLLAPGIFPVLMSRIALTALRKSELRAQLGAALPWLSIFALAWSVGEASGYIVNLRRPPGDRRNYDCRNLS